MNSRRGHCARTAQRQSDSRSSVKKNRDSQGRLTVRAKAALGFSFRFHFRRYLTIFSGLAKFPSGMFVFCPVMTLGLTHVGSGGGIGDGAMRQHS